ncbi:hypothetical protein AB0N74_28920, partial [Streptomyces anulatus]
FVNAVLDAVIAIANGGQAGVPKLIETALATSIPLLIGFLAALLGIGGLANKVKSVFQSVSRPVTRAIDKIVDFIAKKGKALWSKSKGKESDKGREAERKREADPAKEKEATVRLNMQGSSHTLYFVSGRQTEMASRRKDLRETVGKMSRALGGQESDEAQIEKMYLDEIENKMIDAEKALTAQGATSKAFRAASNSVVSAIAEYAELTGRDDIELGSAREEVRKIVEAKNTEFVPASTYKKHWPLPPGRAQEVAIERDAGQYIISEEEIAELERDTLLTGTLVDKTNGNYHAYKKYSIQLGWEAVGKGSKKDKKVVAAFVLRAEISSRQIHSHPRTDFGK